MNKFMPFVSIIIANYNGEKFLPVCLRSVFKTDYKNFEIIIVDDGSTDGSEEIIKNLQKKYKFIRFEKNKVNMGAAAGRNKAVKIAKGEILVFLDNDTEVDKNWLSEMIKTLSRDKKIGACQSLLIDFEDRNKIQVAGVKLWADTAWGLPIGQGEIAHKQFHDGLDIIALSAALAVRRSVFELVEGFDELEAVVTEDLDLSWRIWIAGFRVVLSSESKVFHWSKKISMRENMHHNEETIYFHLTKNSITSILKNYQLANAIWYMFTAVAISFGRAGLVLLRRKDFSALKGTLRGIWWVIIHLFIILKKRAYIKNIRINNDKMLFDIIFAKGLVFDIYKRYFIRTGLL